MKLLLGVSLLFISLQFDAQNHFMLPADAENFYNSNQEAVSIKYRKAVDLVANELKGKDATIDEIVSLLGNNTVIDKVDSAGREVLVLFVLIKLSRYEIQEMKGIVAEQKIEAATQQSNASRASVSKKKTSNPADHTGEAGKQKARQEELALPAEAPDRLGKLIERRTYTNEMISKQFEKIRAAGMAIPKNLR